MNAYNNTADHAEIVEFNSKLARKLQGLKRDLRAIVVSQGYKGTGSRIHRRQIFIRLFNERAIDIWLENGHVSFNGVIRQNVGSLSCEGKSVNDVYHEIVERLRPLSGLPQ